MKQKMTVEMTGCFSQQASTLHLSVARSGSTTHRGTRQSHANSDPISLALTDMFDSFSSCMRNAKIALPYVMIHSCSPKMNDTFVYLLIYMFAETFKSVWMVFKINTFNLQILLFLYSKHSNSMSTAFQQHTKIKLWPTLMKHFQIDLSLMNIIFIFIMNKWHFTLKYFLSRVTAHCTVTIWGDGSQKLNPRSPMHCSFPATAAGYN